MAVISDRIIAFYRVWTVPKQNSKEQSEHTARANYLAIFTSIPCVLIFKDNSRKLLIIKLDRKTKGLQRLGIFQGSEE